MQPKKLAALLPGLHGQQQTEQRRYAQQLAAGHQASARAAVGPQAEGDRQQQEGNVCAVASAPISPGPAPSISTATMGTAARLSCSADWAASLPATRRLSAAGSGVTMAFIIAEPAAVRRPHSDP